MGTWEEYEAEQAAIAAQLAQMEPARAIVLRELEAAWPPHPLDVSSREWDDEDGKDAFRDPIRGKTWLEIPDEVSAYHYYMLSIIKPTALSEFLPAWLASAMRRESMVQSWLMYQLVPGDSPERFHARFDGLTPAQQLAIAHTLDVLVLRYAGKPFSREIENIRKTYWSV